MSHAPSSKEPDEYDLVSISELTKQGDEDLAAGNVDLAAKKYKAALMKAKAAGGGVSSIRDKIISLYGKAKQYRNAIPYIRERATSLHVLYGKSDRKYILDLNLLALYHYYCKEYKPAEKLYVDCIALDEKHYSSSHFTDRKTILNNYILCLKDSKSLYKTVDEKIEFIYNKTTPIYRKLLKAHKSSGSTKSQIWKAQNDLALSLQDERKYTEAAVVFKDLFDITKNPDMPSHRDHCVYLNNYALNHYYLQNYEQAKPLYERAYKICKEQYSTNHDNRILFGMNLLLCRQEMGAFYTDCKSFIKELNDFLEKEFKTTKVETYLYEKERLVTMTWDLGGKLDAINICSELYSFARQVQPSSKLTFQLGNDLGLYYKDVGNFQQAIEVMKPNLERAREALGMESDRAIIYTSNLGLVYYSMVDNETALKYYNKAIELHEKYHPPNKNLLVFYDNKCLALEEQGKTKGKDMNGVLPELASIYEKICKSKTDIHGATSLETLKSRKHYAKTLHRMGQTSKALEIFKETYNVLKKQQLCIVRLEVCNEYALTLKDVRLYSRCIPLFKQNIAAAIMFCGSPESNYPVMYKNNLGLVYYEMKNYVKAYPLYKEAVTLGEKLGDKYTMNLLTYMNNLLLCIKHQNPHSSELISLGEKYMALYEKTHGKVSNEILRDLGKAYCDKTMYTKALPLFKKYYENHKVTYGLVSSRTLAAKNILALLYMDMKKYDEAIPMFKEMVETAEKSLGEFHSDTLVYLNNLGLCHYNKKEYTKALPYYEKACKLQEKYMGVNPNTLTYISNLQLCYSKLGNYTMSQAMISKKKKMEATAQSAPQGESKVPEDAYTSLIAIDKTTTENSTEILVDFSDPPPPEQWGEKLGW